MYNTSEKEQLESILNTNSQLSKEQREALKGALKRYVFGMSIAEYIEIVKLIAAILLMSHQT